MTIEHEVYASPRGPVKPRIRKLAREFYQCEGGGAVGFGRDAKEAWDHWVYRRTALLAFEQNKDWSYRWLRNPN